MTQDFHSLALSNLEKYLKAQKMIERMETSALVAYKKVASKNPPEYEASKALEVDFWYKRAVANRNGFQLAANTFFLAAISAALNRDTQK